VLIIVSAIFYESAMRRELVAPTVRAARPPIGKVASGQKLRKSAGEIA